MTTKKDLNKKSKEELVNLIYKFQQFFFNIEREISHEIYEYLLEEMYFEALDGRIPQADFFGATRFAERFNNLVYKRINEMIEYHGIREIMNDPRFEFSNWYTPIDIFREKKNE